MAEGKTQSRFDGRTPVQLRSINFRPGFISYPEGSVLIEQGNTHVLCNVTVEQSVPSWMQAQNIAGGWLTAEYAMLPRSTHQRVPRDTIRPNSRNQEIRRLIGRSLRAGIDLEQLPPITCLIDCDVLQADGGTRTAAVTGGFVALMIALNSFLSSTMNLPAVLKSQIAAVSVGSFADRLLLDLNYEEDSRADADLNVVMNRDFALIELQGTAERASITRDQLQGMLNLAESGVTELFHHQRECLRKLGIELPVSGG